MEKFVGVRMEKLGNSMERFLNAVLDFLTPLMNFVVDHWLATILVIVLLVLLAARNERIGNRIMGFAIDHWLLTSLGFMLFVGALFIFVLDFIDSLVPGLGGQTLGFLTAATTAILALLGVLVTQAINVYTAWSAQRREQENAQETELQNYLKEGFQETQSSDQRAAAMARARSLLLQLDRNRKGVLLRFLHEAGKIKVKESEKHKSQKDEAEKNEEEARDKYDKEPPVRLGGANLSGAKLEGIDLSGDNLSGANLRGVDLRGADLRSADLTDVDLGEPRWNDLSIVELIRFYVDSYTAKNPAPRKADLREADLRGAILTGAQGLSENQIKPAKGDDSTELPKGWSQPSNWSQSNGEQHEGDATKVDKENSDTGPQQGEAQPREPGAAARVVHALQRREPRLKETKLQRTLRKFEERKGVAKREDTKQGDE
jgi:uncharacterized protein YjbI with pentapeptide repeats